MHYKFDLPKHLSDRDKQEFSETCIAFSSNYSVNGDVVTATFASDDLAERLLVIAETLHIPTEKIEGTPDNI